MIPLSRRIQYVLDDNNRPVHEPDMVKWGGFMKASGRRLVGKDAIGNVFISTVFLGLDQRMDGSQGPPILWESMVWQGDAVKRGSVIHQDRCSGTWEQAEAMHAQLVEIFTLKQSHLTS